MPRSCWQNQQVKQNQQIKKDQQVKQDQQVQQEAHPEAVAFYPVTPVLLAGLNLLDCLDWHQVAADQVKVQTIAVHSCCHQLILCLGPDHLGW